MAKYSLCTNLRHIEHPSIDSNCQINFITNFLHRDKHVYGTETCSVCTAQAYYQLILYVQSNTE